jgi:hypothetical protein
MVVGAGFQPAHQSPPWAVAVATKSDALEATHRPFNKMPCLGASLRWMVFAFFVMQLCDAEIESACICEICSFEAR